MSKLAVFDVDGTLTDTSAVDSDCYLAALGSALDVREVDSDWDTYTDCTDAGILAEVFHARYGRRPSTLEVSRFVDEFARRLQASHREDAARFAPIAGAPQLLQRLRRCQEWHVAIATGGWDRSARLKLGFAAIAVDGVPLASADDSPSRETILRCAIQRARNHWGPVSFSRIVAVGDAEWDVRAASRLALPFVGVASGDRAETLRARGARTILEDFRDTDQAICCLETAGAPRSYPSGSS
jgi:phosphoglycolate phosphatase-like HAD superfamily hydrolase